MELDSFVSVTKIHSLIDKSFINLIYNYYWLNLLHMKGEKGIKGAGTPLSTSAKIDRPSIKWRIKVLFIW